MYVSYANAQDNLIAYWKFNEKNDGTVTNFLDYSSPGTNSLDPSTQLASTTL